MLTTTKVAQALTFAWDENSTQGGFFTLSNVVSVPGADTDLDRNTSDFRVGHFQEKLRRRMTPATAERNATTINASIGGISIAAQDGNVENIGGIGGQYAYKKQWQLVTTVAYINDGATYNNNVINDFNFTTVPLAAGALSNIKMVTVTATDNTPGAAGTQVVLRSFSSNIGETEFYKRRY